NDTPVIESTPSTEAAEDVAYSYTLVASDEDVADTLTLSAETLPGWLSFAPVSGLLSGTPGDNDGGANAVVLRASDAAGAFAEQSFTIVVSVDNDAPVFVSPTPSGTLSVDE